MSLGTVGTFFLAAIVLAIVLWGPSSSAAAKPDRDVNASLFTLDRPEPPAPKNLLNQPDLDEEQTEQAAATQSELVAELNNAVCNFHSLTSEAKSNGRCP
jgi:hypothetical protein